MSNKRIKRHYFSYELITAKGITIKSRRRFRNRSSAKRVLEMFYTGCLIMDIKTDNSGDFGFDFRQRLG